MNVAGYYWLPLALAGYYLLAWLMVGRRREPQSIVIRYGPPAGLSPAVIRYLFTLNCDGRTLAAVLAQLAARSEIAVTPRDGSVYLTWRQKDHQQLERLSDEERFVLKNIFQWHDADVELQKPDSDLMQKFQKLLQAKANQYVSRNILYVALAVTASAIAAGWLSWSLQLFGHDPVEAMVLTSFTGLTVGMFIAASTYLWDRNLQAVKLAFRGLYHRHVIPILFVLVFLFPALWYLLMRGAAPVFANVTGLLILINMFAAPALRNYSPAGRQLLVEVLGFREFLQCAEQDRMQRLNQPGQSLQAEKDFLPYAIALDVREGWGDELGIRAMVETAL